MPSILKVTVLSRISAPEVYTDYYDLKCFVSSFTLTLNLIVPKLSKTPMRRVDINWSLNNTRGVSLGYTSCRVLAKSCGVPAYENTPKDKVGLIYVQGY
jgi:hypothetical protein